MVAAVNWAVSTYMSDLLVAGGGDAGLGFVRPLQPVHP